MLALNANSLLVYTKFIFDCEESCYLIKTVSQISVPGTNQCQAIGVKFLFSRKEWLIPDWV